MHLNVVGVDNVSFQINIKTKRSGVAAFQIRSKNRTGILGGNTCNTTKRGS